MTTIALCWIAALVVAFITTVGLIRGGSRHEQLEFIPINLDTDADPRRHRRPD